MDIGEFSLTDGLVGDSWKNRSSSRTLDKSAHPDMQLNIMNSRVIALVAGQKERWHLAGDQLFVDLDLSAENLPPGTRLALGAAVIEVTDQPHTGCKKFAARFGTDALKFVSTPLAREINLRGVNARVVQPGTIRTGDAVSRMPATPDHQPSQVATGERPGLSLARARRSPHASRGVSSRLAHSPMEAS
jgi:hypothetical protein